MFLPLLLSARKIQPDEKPEWRFAYNTTMTKEELETEQSHQKERLVKIQTLMNRVLNSIKGATNTDSLDIEKHKHCFIRQLNANLYPGRPKVGGHVMPCPVSCETCELCST